MTMANTMPAAIAKLANGASSAGTRVIGAVTAAIVSGRTVRRPTRSSRPAATSATPISTQPKRKLRASAPSALTVSMPTSGRNRIRATNAARPHSFNAAGQSIRSVVAALSVRTRPATASDLLDLGLAEQAGGQEDQHQDQDRERRDVLVLDREITGPE